MKKQSIDVLNKKPYICQPSVLCVSRKMFDSSENQYFHISIGTLEPPNNTNVEAID